MGRPAGSGCSRCSCRWPSAPSSSASTRRTMAALSMATIAAFVNGPGLGSPSSRPQHAQRRRGLRARPVHRADGDHARPRHHRGQRARRAARRARQARRRPPSRASWWLRGGRRRGRGLPVAHTTPGRRSFPTGLDSAPTRRPASRTSSTGSRRTGSATAERLSDRVHDAVLNPLQDLLAKSPWWSRRAAIARLRLVLGGGARSSPRDLPGRALWPGPVERRDGDADHRPSSPPSW